MPKKINVSSQIAFTYMLILTFLHTNDYTVNNPA